MPRNISKISHLASLIATVLMLSASLAAQSQAASFDCKKAGTPVEKTICANPELSRLDEELMATYRKVAATEKQAQRAWLKYRDTCGTDVNCLTSLYQERVSKLQRVAGQQERNAPAASKRLIPNAQCAVIVMASKDTQLVLDTLKKYQDIAPSPSAIESNNGFFAASLGIFDRAEGASFIKAQLANGLLPKDAYCGNTERYVRVLYPSAAFTALSDSADGSKESARTATKPQLEPNIKTTVETGPINKDTNNSKENELAELEAHFALETERKRLAAMQEQDREAALRLEREKVLATEQERLRLEQERLVKERIEKERLAKLEADKQAKIEADKKAKAEVDKKNAQEIDQKTEAIQKEFNSNANQFKSASTTKWTFSQKKDAMTGAVEVSITAQVSLESGLLESKLICTKDGGVHASFTAQALAFPIQYERHKNDLAALKGYNCLVQGNKYWINGRIKINDEVKSLAYCISNDYQNLAEMLLVDGPSLANIRKTVWGVMFELPTNVGNALFYLPSTDPAVENLYAHCSGSDPRVIKSGSDESLFATAAGIKPDDQPVGFKINSDPATHSLKAMDTRIKFLSGQCETDDKKAKFKFQIKKLPRIFSTSIPKEMGELVEALLDRQNTQTLDGLIEINYSVWAGRDATNLGPIEMPFALVHSPEQNETVSFVTRDSSEQDRYVMTITRDTLSVEFFDMYGQDKGVFGLLKPKFKLDGKCEVQAAPK